MSSEMVHGTASTGRGADRAYRAMIRFGRLIFGLLGLRRDVRGAQHVPASGGAVLAVTHFGYLDFALVQDAVWRRTRRYTRFLVTDVAFGHPLAGPLLRSMGHIPVHRAAGAGAYRTALRALRCGELVGVFPESAVSVTTELLPLKRGAAGLAAETGLPLIPVLVWGGQQVITKGLPLRWRHARNAEIHIEFGAPLFPSAHSDRHAVTEQLRGALTAMIEKMVVVAPERSYERVKARRMTRGALDAGGTARP